MSIQKISETKESYRTEFLRTRELCGTASWHYEFAKKELQGSILDLVVFASQVAINIQFFGWAIVRIPRFDAVDGIAHPSVFTVLATMLLSVSAILMTIHFSVAILRLYFEAIEQSEKLWTCRPRFLETRREFNQARKEFIAFSKQRNKGGGNESKQ